MTTIGSLNVTTPTDREIRMTRDFNAPRTLVFDAMTKPDLLKRWLFGPGGWSLDVCEIDLRVGGTFYYLWRGPGGKEMSMRGVYRDITPPERIVQTEVFDEAWYPGEAVGTLVLTEERGRTHLTLTILYDSRETRDGVLRTRMADGLSMGYDRLADILATLA